MAGQARFASSRSMTFTGGSCSVEDLSRLLEGLPPTATVRIQHRPGDPHDQRDVATTTLTVATD
jgi:hypothetical protein